MKNIKEFGGHGLNYSETEAWERVYNAVLIPNCHENKLFKEEAENCKKGIRSDSLNGYQYKMSNNWPIIFNKG